MKAYWQYTRMHYDGFSVPELVFCVKNRGDFESAFCDKLKSLHKNSNINILACYF